MKNAPWQRSVNFEMSFWCLQFFQKMNLKTQIFALDYLLGQKFFVRLLEELKKTKCLSKLTDLQIAALLLYTSKLVQKAPKKRICARTGRGKNLVKTLHQKRTVVDGSIILLVLVVVMHAHVVQKLLGFQKLPLILNNFVAGKKCRENVA